MAGLILKPYQDRALDALDTFLDVAGTNNHVAAYDAACVVGDPGQYRRAYTPFVGLPDTPWACLRLPTGGGKTLLASHAVGIAHRRSMQNARYPVVLWLVTSTTIADQTLVALKTSGHPYRIALDDAFGGAVRAIGIDERRALKPQDLATAATVIVATVQSFRVTNAAGRKVYQDDEEYEGFFKGQRA
jgi:type III restriction enzyme